MAIIVAGLGFAPEHVPAQIRELLPQAGLIAAGQSSLDLIAEDYGPLNGRCLPLGRDLAAVFAKLWDAHTAGQTVLHFSGLALPSGSVLEVGTDEHCVFYARIGNESVLSKRTAESSDELRLEAGKFGKLSVSTDGKAKTRFGVRGYYT